MDKDVQDRFQSLEDLIRQRPGGGPVPRSVGDDFQNESERNAGEQTDSQTAWEVNRKRTYDAYQDFDIQALRAQQGMNAKLDQISIQALQNAVETANMVGKQAIKHADVAADALWTDELNPVTRGVGNVETGQAPVNSQLASTASLDVAFNNLSAQLATLVTGFVTQAQALAQSNAQMVANNAAIVAALAQLVQNSKQAGPTA